MQKGTPRYTTGKKLLFIIGTILVAVCALELAQDRGLACRQKDPVPTKNVGTESSILGLREAIERIIRDFRLDDDVQKRLFALAMRSGRNPKAVPVSLSIVLLRPHLNGLPLREFFEMRNADLGFSLRMTKISSKKISSFFAIITYVDNENKNVIVFEKCFCFESDRGWYEVTGQRGAGKAGTKGKTEGKTGTYILCLQ